ncbi:DNA polymerase (family 10) [Thermosyntropha lipolytica DSM 11003]|uniref:DNA polymerase beta n=1 Tax=Thermosyntropha lipolytica DSM 11003 TaxID=1123382 RepID=A0A1M5K8N6_9FIRM|nr:DNA polymerase/3'-5' exonuclease PolX [Thermosyntropha lipolytica]SHG48533.1 DNA polymerase (family 10) [Thermosyntropha lipolytica DSM 11003]
MTNRQVADILNRIADILLIKDENPFKIKAYRNAAQAIYYLDEDVRLLYEKGKLEEIPGVGKAVREKIEEMLLTGQLAYYENLLQEVPTGVLDMLAIPGIGHKTVKLIYEKTGIASIDDLLKAAEEGRLRSIPGIGEKTEDNIKKGIAMLKQNSGKVNLGIALPLAEKFRDFLLADEKILNASIVGSLRRGKPLVRDIDILVAAYDYKAVHKRAEKFEEVKKIARKNRENVQGKLIYDIDFEIIIVPPEDYYHSLIWTTGSKAHRQVLLAGVDRKSLRGLNREEEVYAQLGIQYIPPELRENRGEIEKARLNLLPPLVEFGDIKGDLHVHSDWSDGGHDIEEMVSKARKKGYNYLAITDHSKSLPISGGLSEERLKAQGKVIDELNQKLNGFKVLKGIEVDILKDGSLDYGDEILENLDIVVASIHSHFKLDKEEQTRRIINAIKSNKVNIIGHLTGRLLNRRNGYELDIDSILKAAAAHKVALEINSHPERLDIDEETAMKAKEYGVKIAVSSDAHHREDLDLIRYGVINARRGWLTPDDIINTWPLDKLISFLNRD